MASKSTQKQGSEAADIKKLIDTKRAVIGTERVKRVLLAGNASRIYLASNTSDDVREDIKRYGALAHVEIIELSQPSDELGALCKKPFNVSVLAARTDEPGK